MIGICNPKLYFWRICSWRSATGQHSHEFTLFVSRAFCEAAANTNFSFDRCQMMARSMAKEAGLGVADWHNLLHFGKHGLHQIDWPLGGGTWLAICDEGDEGCMYSTHNVDGSKQQSFLMAVWIWWADAVEAVMTLQKGEETKGT